MWASIQTISTAEVMIESRAQKPGFIARNGGTVCRSFAPMSDDTHAK
jgi:hypothetical protein